MYLVELTLDGVGITGVVNDFSKYPANYKTIIDMYVSNGTLFISHDQGIATIGLQTHEHSVFLPNGSASCTEVQGIAPIGDLEEIVFADMGSRHIKMVSTDTEVQVLAGLGEEGNNDGTHGHHFHSLWVFAWRIREYFFYDAQVGAVKLITDARSAVQFLENLGKL